MVEFPLDLQLVAGFVDNRPGEIGLDVGEPGSEAAHVFVKLLHRHQGLSQLFHPDPGTDSAIKSESNMDDSKSK